MQGARFAQNHWQILSGIVNRLAALEAARMLADNGAIPSDDDAVGIGVNFGRASDRIRLDRTGVVVKMHQSGPDDGRHMAMKAIE